jgi:hypothetical protein
MRLICIPHELVVPMTNEFYFIHNYRAFLLDRNGVEGEGQEKSQMIWLNIGDPTFP